MTNSALVLNSCHRAHEVLVLIGPPQTISVTAHTCVRLRRFVFDARYFVCSALYCTVRQESFWLLQVPYFIWQILSLPVRQLIAQNLADLARWLMPRHRRDIISVQSLKVINFVIKTPRPFCLAAKLVFIRLRTLNRHRSAESPTPLIHTKIPYLKLIKVCRCVTSATRNRILGRCFCDSK